MDRPTHTDAKGTRSPAVRPTPLLLYDGSCGMCNDAVQFVLARDPNGTMRFAPLGGTTAERILEGSPGLRDVDSLILVHERNGHRVVSVHSDATLAVARYLGGPWALLGWLRLFPRSLRDGAYRALARHRHHFGRGRTCCIPPPAPGGRFLP